MIISNSKLRYFIRNFSYSFSSNIFSLLLSALTVLIVPKLVGTETYGYYQLYIFYAGYTAVLNFGWNDGIYLKIGGKAFSELDTHLYSLQYRLLFILEIFIYSILAAFTIFHIDDPSRQITLICVCISAIIVNPRWILVYALQATNEIKRYTIVTVTERIVTVFFLVFFTLGLGKKDVLWLLFSDLIGKSIATIVIIWFCRNIVFSKPCKLDEAKLEIRDNISAGIRLMFASLASMLIIGVIRFGIERHWGVDTFGKVSLSLSISNMAMQAISAIALVLYPVLRRISTNLLSDLYRTMRVFLMAFGFGVMIFYYPLERILVYWLPSYSDSLKYVALLLPICIYEGKSQMLLNTYYKSFRLESKLFYNNVLSLIFAIFAIFVSSYLIDNLTLAVLSILFAMVFRSVLSELILSKVLKIGVISSIIKEILMTLAFIICNWFFGLYGFFVYIFCFAFYIFSSKNEFKHSLIFIKSHN